MFMLTILKKEKKLNVYSKCFYDNATFKLYWIKIFHNFKNNQKMIDFLLVFKLYVFVFFWRWQLSFIEEVWKKSPPQRRDTQDLPNISSVKCFKFEILSKNLVHLLANYKPYISFIHLINNLLLSYKLKL